MSGEPGPRHTRLHARENESERNNQIVFAFDCGQAMCEPVDGLPRLDRAVTAALTSAYVALKSGDRVALFGFARHPQILTPFVSETRAFRRLQAAAAGLDYHATEPNFTLALALISVLAIQAFGISAWGFVKHAGKYFTVKSPIQCAVGILEFISELAKILSFSFRLFGNIFAGEVLLIITGFLVPYVVPVPFLMLELFVGFVQALVFAMLTTVFLGIATASEHG